MERFFIFDKFNTWYDWRLIVTNKDVTPPEPKTNYVNIDGMSGTLDLSQALTGDITYGDRTLTASFWTADGTHKERAEKIVDICNELHGKKVKIIEPDDPAHYFYGRIKIGNIKNNLAYAEFQLTATCEPWRYSIDESERRADANGDTVDLVITNNGVKTVCPIITVTGDITLNFNGVANTLSAGSYKLVNIRLKRGTNIIKVSGSGSAVFRYTEARL